MQKRVNHFSAISAIFILALAMQSTARADGFYVGAGTYEADADVAGFDGDDNTTAVTIGYTLIDSSVFMLSAEISQYDLGDFSGAGIEIETEALAIAAVAYLPLGPFIELYAKAGVASVEVDINGREFDDDENFRGLGIGLDVLDTIDLFAEYLTFDSEADSDLFGIGLRFDF